MSLLAAVLAFLVRGVLGALAGDAWRRSHRPTACAAARRSWRQPSPSRARLSRAFDRRAGGAGMTGLTAFGAAFALVFTTGFAFAVRLGGRLLPFGAETLRRRRFLAGRAGWLPRGRFLGGGFARRRLRRSSLARSRLALRTGGRFAGGFAEFLAMVIPDRHGARWSVLRRSSRAAPERWGRRGKTSNYSSRQPLW